MLVDSYVALLVVRAMSGFSSGVAYAAASAAAADLAPYARRAAVMGKFNAGLFLAIPVGMPVTVLLSSLGFWQMTFALQAAFGALASWWPVGEHCNIQFACLWSYQTPWERN